MIAFCFDSFPRYTFFYSQVCLRNVYNHTTFISVSFLMLYVLSYTLPPLYLYTSFKFCLFLLPCLFSFFFFLKYSIEDLIFCTWYVLHFYIFIIFHVSFISMSVASSLIGTYLLWSSITLIQQSLHRDMFKWLLYLLSEGSNFQIGFFPLSYFELKTIKSSGNLFKKKKQKLSNVLDKSYTKHMVNRPILSF